METNLELASRVAEHGDVTKQLIIVMIGVAAVVAALSAALHLEATEEQRRSDGLVEKGLATEQWQFALNQTRAELIASTDDVILRAGDSIGAVAHSTNEVGR